MQSLKAKEWFARRTLDDSRASLLGRLDMGKREISMVNMGVEPRTLALLAPRSKPTELIDRDYHVIDG